MQHAGLAYSEAGVDVVEPAGSDVVHGPGHVLDASACDDVGIGSEKSPENTEQFVEFVKTGGQAHPHHRGAAFLYRQRVEANTLRDRGEVAAVVRPRRGAFAG